jgi:hypothetical protein
LGKVFKTLIFTYLQGIEEEHDEGFHRRKGEGSCRGSL